MDLARSFAIWLRQPKARLALLDAVAQSPYREGKVPWATLATTTRRGPYAEMALGFEKGLTTRAAPMLEAFSDLEVYFPVPEHRARWSGDTNLIVLVSLRDERRANQLVGFDLQGRSVKLSGATPPQTPVLVIHRPEGYVRSPSRDAMCYEDCGGGGGGGPPAPPQGFFLTSWTISDDFESWTAGNPEFEITAYHTEPPFLLPTFCDVDGVTCFRIRLEGWACAAGDYPAGHLRDWYYNTPPELLTGEVMIMDASQAAGFGATPWGRLVISEDDGDGTCKDGYFPTAWNPGPGVGGLNDDEMVGEIALGNPQTANNVSFGGVATMSFLRR